MIHNTTNISARSGCGLTSAEALLGGYKGRHYIRTYKLTINTDQDITNTGPKHVQCNSVPKQILIIIQNWQCSR